jgi:hypothetical protein
MASMMLASLSFGDVSGPDFFLIEGDPADHAHYAFRAPNRAAVRACYELGSGLGALDRPPALARTFIPTTTRLTCATLTAGWWNSSATKPGSADVLRRGASRLY